MQKKQRLFRNPDGGQSTAPQEGWTPLHRAALSGDTTCCKHIVERHTILDNGDIKSLLGQTTARSCSTPLHFAVLSGSVACLECLVGYLLTRAHPRIAADILTHQSTPTPFDTSSFVNMSESDFAESFGPSELLSLSRRTGFSAMDLAVICDNTRATNLLLDAMHQSCSNSDRYEDCRRSSVPSMMSMTIPSPHAIKPFIGSDILQAAIAKGNADIVVALLDRGASLEEPTHDERGMRPIHWAIGLGQGTIVSLLLERGADPMSVTSVTEETAQDISMLCLGEVGEVRRLFDEHPYNEL